MGREISDPANTVLTTLTGTELLSCSGLGPTVIPVSVLKTDFGTFQAWIPIHGGFTVEPTYIARSCRIGNLGILIYNVSANGTGTGTTYTLPLPTGWVAKTGQNAIGSIERVFNNGSAVAANGSVLATGGTSTLTLGINGSGAAWTGSNGRGASFIFFLELNP